MKWPLSTHDKLVPIGVVGSNKPGYVFYKDYDGSVYGMWNGMAMRWLRDGAPYLATFYGHNLIPPKPEPVYRWYVRLDEQIVSEFTDPDRASKEARYLRAESSNVGISRVEIPRPE